MNVIHEPFNLSNSTPKPKKQTTIDTQKASKVDKHQNTCTPSLKRSDCLLFRFPICFFPLETCLSRDLPVYWHRIALRF